jgi:hypothetical protein
MPKKESSAELSALASKVLKRAAELMFQAMITTIC